MSEARRIDGQERPVANLSRKVPQIRKLLICQHMFFPLFDYTLISVLVAVIAIAAIMTTPEIMSWK